MLCVVTAKVPFCRGKGELTRMLEGKLEDLDREQAPFCGWLSLRARRRPNDPSFLSCSSSLSKAHSSCEVLGSRDSHA